VPSAERTKEEGVNGVAKLSIPNLSEDASYLAQSSKGDSPFRSSVSMLDGTWHTFHLVQG
jgi:hypothetical protein